MGSEMCIRDRDDESHQYDRGEELVRRRMRARKRERMWKNHRDMTESPQLSGLTQSQSYRAAPAHFLGRPALPTDATGSLSPGAAQAFGGSPPGSRHTSFARPQKGAGVQPSSVSGNVDDDAGVSGAGDVEEAVADDGDAENKDESEDEDGDDNDPLEYTIKDRQDAFNIEHPFGLPIWKPALYKKSRTVTRKAETAVHCSPDAAPEANKLLIGNVTWSIFFGAGLALLVYVVGLLLYVIPHGGRKYSRVLFELASYIPVSYTHLTLPTNREV